MTKERHIKKILCFFFFQNHRDYKLKLQVAEDYYDLYVTQLVFRDFRKGIELIKKEYQIKWYKAELYHNRYA